MRSVTFRSQHTVACIASQNKCYLCHSTQHSCRKTISAKRARANQSTTPTICRSTEARRQRSPLSASHHLCLSTTWHGLDCRTKAIPPTLSLCHNIQQLPRVNINRAAIDLRIDPFAHGQLYTALSRVLHRDDCFLICSEENEERDSANVVYKSLLL